MRHLAAYLLLLCGCAPRATEPLNALFGRAARNLQAGELALTQAECERGITLARERNNGWFLWKFRLIRAEALLHNSRAEEALIQIAEPMPSESAFAPLAARKELLQGWAFLVLGHREDSDRLLAQAQEDATQSNATDVLVETATFRAAVLIHRDQSSQAEALLRLALQGAQSLHSDYLEAGALVNLGMIHLGRHHYDEAVADFERASEKARSAAPAVYGNARNNLAVCYKNLGEPDRAILIQKETIAHYEHSGEKVLLQFAVGAIGESYVVKGDFRTAISYLQRALGLAIELGRTESAALWATNLAAIYVEINDWANAEAFNQEAIRLKRSIGNSTLAFNTLNAADIAAGKQQLDNAESLYDNALVEGKEEPSVRWDAHSGKALVEIKRNRPAAAAREFEASIEILEKTRSDVSRAELRLPFLAPRIRLYQAYVDALLGQGQVERALAVADSSRAQVLAERTAAAPSRRLSPGAFSKLASASGSVLLSYWLTPTQSHAWIVTPLEVRHIALAGSAEIEPLVKQYQSAIVEQLADPLRTRIAAGEKLYQLLVAPVRQYLPDGSPVILVPDGILHSLNFEALPVPGEPPHYLIQDLIFQIAPSLNAAGVASAKPSTRRLLLLGDAVSDTQEFPPLSAAPLEIADVRKHFAPADQVVRTRDSANPQEFLAAARGGSFAAVHFTAHAVANREMPLESAVVLSGGRLYARDVMDLPLQAELVTVSACRSAGQRTYSGEGLVGFAWAFLRAGARNVIAGLWDVNDQSTAGLMDILYRELALGKRPADALRTAKLSMIESRGNLRKPYYWAPFQLFSTAF
jgi:CHAT domain-containing protein